MASRKSRVWGQTSRARSLIAYHGINFLCSSPPSIQSGRGEGNGERTTPARMRPNARGGILASPKTATLCGISTKIISHTLLTHLYFLSGRVLPMERSLRDRLRPNFSNGHAVTLSDKEGEEYRTDGQCGAAAGRALCPLHSGRERLARSFLALYDSQWLNDANPVTKKNFVPLSGNAGLVA